MRLLWMGIVIGCVFGAVVVYLCRGDRAPTPTMQAATPATPELPSAEIFERLDRLDRSLDDVRSSLARLQANKDGASKPLAPAADPPAPADLPTLAAGVPPTPVPANEPDDLASVSKDVLLSQVKSVTRAHGAQADIEGALQRVQALLDRSLDPAEKAEAFVEEGLLSA